MFIILSTFSTRGRVEVAILISLETVLSSFLVSTILNPISFSILKAYLPLSHLSSPTAAMITSSLSLKATALLIMLVMILQKASGTILLLGNPISSSRSINLRLSFSRYSLIILLGGHPQYPISLSPVLFISVFVII